MTIKSTITAAPKRGPSRDSWGVAEWEGDDYTIIDFNSLTTGNFSQSILPLFFTPFFSFTIYTPSMLLLFPRKKSRKNQKDNKNPGRGKETKFFRGKLFGWQNAVNCAYFGRYFFLQIIFLFSVNILWKKIPFII